MKKRFLYILSAILISINGSTHTKRGRPERRKQRPQSQQQQPAQAVQPPIAHQQDVSPPPPPDVIIDIPDEPFVESVETWHRPREEGPSVGRGMGPGGRNIGPSVGMGFGPGGRGADRRPPEVIGEEILICPGGRGYDAVAFDPGTIEQQNRRLHEHIRALEEENQHLRTQHDQAWQNVNQVVTQMEHLTLQNIRDEAAYNELQQAFDCNLENTERLENEIVQNQEHIREIQAAHEQTIREQGEFFQARFDEQRRLLEQQLHAKWDEQRAAELAQLQAQHTQEMSAISQHYQQLNNARHQHILQQQANLITHENTLNQQEDRIASLEQTIEQKQQELDQLRKRYGMGSAEVAVLQQQINQLEELKDNLERHLLQSNENLAIEQERINELERQLRKERAGRLDDVHAFEARERGMLAEWQAEQWAGIEREMARDAQLTAQHRELTNKIADLEQQIQDAHAGAGANVERLQSERDQLEERLKELDVKMEEELQNLLSETQKKQIGQIEDFLRERWKDHPKRIKGMQEVVQAIELNNAEMSNQQRIDVLKKIKSKSCRFPMGLGKDYGKCHSAEIYLSNLQTQK